MSSKALCAYALMTIVTIIMDTCAGAQLSQTETHARKFAAAAGQKVVSTSLRHDTLLHGYLHSSTEISDCLSKIGQFCSTTALQKTSR